MVLEFGSIAGSLHAEAMAMMCGNDPKFVRTNSERYRGLAEIEKSALTSTLEPSRVLQTSLEVLRDLGMSDDAIVEYFRRFSDALVHVTVDAQRLRAWTTEPEQAGSCRVPELLREFELKPPKPGRLESAAELGWQRTKGPAAERLIMRRGWLYRNARTIDPAGGVV